MFRRSAQALPLFLMVAVVVVVPGSVVATPLLQSLTLQELVVSVIVNQMAILKGLNESSSAFASGSGDLHALREQMVSDVQRMNEQVKEEVQEIHEQLTDRMQAVEEVIEELQTAHNNSSIRQQPDPAVLRLPHNDSYFSLCQGHKVLYGGHGILEGRVVPGERSCSWDVILPEGSRPVFSWAFFKLQNCPSCYCESVTVTEHNLVIAGPSCTQPPSPSNMNVQGNRFHVLFKTHRPRSNSGFKLTYNAVLTKQEQL